MSAPASHELRYTAFLSYSHKDARRAFRLHRRLESFRMPRRLVGTAGARGPVPGRLWPIFRDREELPAATDLGETVRTALAQSGALILLCSPHAAQSLWVAEEMRTFREIHPDRPILAAILEGDPSDCFPAALRAFGRDGSWHEPLATDLRPQGDGERLGLLKLVAGITGVGLDDLVQRDASRRIRRVTAVTTVAVAAMLVMAVLTAVALSARADAERQRAEAEGLIEFMLKDLRQGLRREVGDLGVLTRVNQRALEYYDEQGALIRLGPESLERRARVLHAIGEDDVTRGKLATAFLAFREAYRTTAEQLRRSPSDRQRIFAHAQSEYWVGRVHELRRNWPATRTHYTRYAEAAERLIQLAPNNPDYMMEMGWGALNLGIVELNGARNAAGAEALFRRAEGWFGRAAAARPDDTAARREMANAMAWLADSFYVRRLWHQSLAARLRERRVKEQLLAAEPTNVPAVYDLAITERSVARLAARVGDSQDGLSVLLSAYRRARWLVERDPQNVDWLMLRTRVECDMLRQTNARSRGISDEQLRREIRTAASRFRAQDNPRLSQISTCLEQVNS